MTLKISNPVYSRVSALLPLHKSARLPCW